MNINLKYNNKASISTQANFVFFLNEKLELNQLKEFLKIDEIKYIEQILKIKNKDKTIIFFDLNIKKSISLIKVGEENAYENLGAEFYNFIKENSLDNIFLYADRIKNQNQNFIKNFLHGLKLKSYEFNLYKTKKKIRTISLNIISNNKLEKNDLRYQAIEAGTNFARDLVSEQPNVLYPKEYVNRLFNLKKLGIKVTAYNEIKLKNMGMNSLLGVGKGSARESFLVTLEWNGDRKNNKSPLSFVGKGVCFDTGGISLKPAKFMEEMKYDMAGSAVVAGLIQTLAIRKAKVNAVGVVGLVENMPG